MLKTDCLKRRIVYLVRILVNINPLSQRGREYRRSVLCGELPDGHIGVVGVNRISGKSPSRVNARGWQYLAANMVLEIPAFVAA